MDDGATTDPVGRPIAQAILRHNHDQHGIQSEVIFCDVKDAQENKNRNGSKFCEAYVIAVLTILEKLLRDGFGKEPKACTMAILTPYQAEYKLLLRAKAEMKKVYATAEHVVVETIQKVQGVEYDIVIVDPVCVRQPGFLDKRILNVLFSRARSGLYVVGNHDTWSRMHRSDSYWLRAFARQLVQHKRPWPEDLKTSQFYDPVWAQSRRYDDNDSD
jgi:superfamily I DNA and/or RNA helicase